MASYAIKAGDTNPAFAAQLLDAKGKPIPLAVDDTVEFHMRPKLEGGDGSLDGTCVVTDLLKAMVEYQWQDGDTDRDGNFEAEFEIIFADGSVMSVPNDSYIDLVILPDLG